MALVDVKEIIEAGVHFGHRVSRWHPKMKRYIFGKRNLIHIVDVRETVKGLIRASNFLRQVSATGKEAVFVGTKRQAKPLIMREAQRAGMHWVSERWLGGTLTNFHTIRFRLKRLEELEVLEQDGSIEQYSKKRISALRRERRKILRNLEGLRNMKELPGCLVVVDIRNEHIAVKEARKVGVPVVGLVDTDCDPRDVDIVIPGNDDAYRSIQIILRVLSDAIIAGRDKYVATQAELERAKEETEERARQAGSDQEASSAEKTAEASRKPEAGEKPASGAGSAVEETSRTRKVAGDSSRGAKPEDASDLGKERNGGAGAAKDRGGTSGAEKGSSEPGSSKAVDRPGQRSASQEKAEGDKGQESRTASSVDTTTAASS